MVRVFRALSGKSQRKFGQATGVHPNLIADYEEDKVEPSDEHLERLARGADLTVSAGDQILRFADALRTPRQRTGQGIEELVGPIVTVASAAYQRLLRLPLPEDTPKAEDRQRAKELWLVLADLDEGQQLAMVQADRDFQNWALAELVAEASVEQASRDLDIAASRARLAREIADRVRGPEGWCNRVRGYAAALGPNVLRVAGEWESAEAGFLQAQRLWDAGSDPAGVLDPGRLLDLKASLRRDQRRFGEALDLLDQARDVSHCPGRVLVNKGFTLEVMGEYERAIDILVEAEPLVEREGNPRLSYMRRFNLAVCDTHLGRFAGATELAQKVREVATARGDENEVSRVTWLEGRIAAGLGRREEALQLLGQARQEFATRNMGYDVALALLEEAVLLLEEGKTAEVKVLAQDLAKVFNSKGVHREALAALQLFHEAAERETATAELARRVLRYLFRARYDQGLRFTDS
jgi:tetratricopeptide (TPR) repeat protein